MRLLLPLALLGAAFPLVGCQDSYASNSEREAYMGDVRAAAAPAPAASAAAAAAAPAPAAAPVGNPAASAPAAPTPAPSH